MYHVGVSNDRLILNSAWGGFRFCFITIKLMYSDYHSENSYLYVTIYTRVTHRRVVTRGGRYSGYIVIPQYYFEAITVSRKFLLSGIIVIPILSRFTKDSLYALNYTNLVRMAECHVESTVA